MNNNNLILFILVICVIYLLYKVNKTVGFANNAIDEETITITESIKNLGIIVRQIQDGGNLILPADVNINGKLNLLPEGTIVMWGKTNIPDGWVKCDGLNDTPDLRGKFVLGEGQGKDSLGNNLSNRILNNEGGEESHQLTIDEMPSHEHAYAKLGYVARNNKDANIKHHSQATIKINGGGGVTDSAGSGHAHNNMPPFWVLIYIMKVY